MGSSVHDAATVAAMVAPYLAGLQGLGGEVVSGPVADGLPSLLLVATGGTEKALLDAWDRSGPLLLLAHPGHNSLPASLEALAAVRQQSGRGRIVYLAGPDDAASLAEVRAAVDDLQTAAALRRARLGLIGGPSDWLVASSPSAEVVRRVWGPTVVLIEMARLLAACDAAAGSEEKAIEEALHSLVREEALDGITVRCFDLIGARRATACLPLSTLNDEGVVAGCEGDLPSAVALLWVRSLLGTAGWMANPARLDGPSGTITLAHCTVPRRMVTDARLDTHFESGLGKALAGTIPPGPATLLRIGGQGMERLWLAEGEVTSSGSEPDLCRTQADVRVGSDRVEELLTHPLGNHLVMIPGHHGRRLGAWWQAFVGPA